MQIQRFFFIFLNFSDTVGMEKTIAINEKIKSLVPQYNQWVDCNKGHACDRAVRKQAGLLRGGDKGEPPTPPDMFYKDARNYIMEMHRLRLYCNEEFKKVGAIYSQKFPYINKRWITK